MDPTLLLTPLLPLWLALTAAHPRTRGGLTQRWGVTVAPVAAGSIWVHAASVGEVNAASSLVRRLPRPVLLTADTDTGTARALQLAKELPGVVASHKPVDHPWTLAPLWADARPKAVVFVEGTFWPALARMARRAGVPVLRVSAKAGSRTRALGSLSAWWAREVDVVLARDAHEAAFFARAYRGRPVFVGISGDLKGDIAAQAPLLRWSRPFAVAASAQPGDVARVLQALSTLGLDLQLLAAPRHPDRFDICELSGRSWLARSAMTGDEVPADIDVLLLDTLGELASALVGARFAMIGGSFHPGIGAHSPMEARRAGVPVVAGPFVSSQGDAFASASVGDDLASAIRAARPPEPPLAGAASRIASVIRSLGTVPAPESSPRPWAAPLSSVVGLWSTAKSQAYARGWLPTVSVPVPVISIGSTNARSPGRTSTVRAVTAELIARGHTVGVALRGYKRQVGGRLVHLSDDVSRVGDEGALLAASGALVAAGPDRVACARQLVARGVTVIVLDDGLGAQSLHRDLEVVVIDARFPAARGLLPMGERREVRPVPIRAQLVLVHHGDGVFSFPGASVHRRPGAWVPGPPVGPVAAFAGIGRPADFLASLDVPVDRFLSLPDHSPLDADMLLAWADGLPLVCTAKDAVRLPVALRGRVAWRDLEVVLPESLLVRLPVLRLDQGVLGTSGSGVGEGGRP